MYHELVLQAKGRAELSSRGRALLNGAAPVPCPGWCQQLSPSPSQNGLQFSRHACELGE